MKQKLLKSVIDKCVLAFKEQKEKVVTIVEIYYI